VVATGPLASKSPVSDGCVDVVGRAGWRAGFVGRTTAAHRGSSGILLASKIVPRWVAHALLRVPWFVEGKSPNCFMRDECRRVSRKKGGRRKHFMLVCDMARVGPLIISSLTDMFRWVASAEWKGLDGASCRHSG